MNSVTDLLRGIVSLLDECGIDHMLTGSFVSTFYGEPRATQDIDLVIAVRTDEPDALRKFVDRIESMGLYVARGAALDPIVGRRQFNVIAPNGWKVDLMVREDRPFSRSEFERRRRRSVVGVDVDIASAEDVVLAKLEWGGSVESRQFADVVGVLSVLPDVDESYLDRWAVELGLTPLLAEARRRAARSM